MLVVEDVERVERVKEAAKALVFDDNKCTFRRGFPSFHHRVMGMAE